jgi:hypothetical protein
LRVHSRSGPIDRLPPSPNDIGIQTYDAVARLLGVQRSPMKMNLFCFWSYGITLVLCELKVLAAPDPLIGFPRSVNWPRMFSEVAYLAGFASHPVAPEVTR